MAAMLNTPSASRPRSTARHALALASGLLAVLLAGCGESIDPVGEWRLDASAIDDAIAHAGMEGDSGALLFKEMLTATGVSLRVQENGKFQQSMGAPTGAPGAAPMGMLFRGDWRMDGKRLVLEITQANEQMLEDPRRVEAEFIDEDHLYLPIHQEQFPAPMRRGAGAQEAQSE